MAKNNRKWQCTLCGLQVKESERRKHAESEHGFPIRKRMKTNSTTKVKKVVVKKEAKSSITRKIDGKEITEAVDKNQTQKKLTEKVARVSLIEGRRATKCNGIHKCFRCGKNHLETWLYKGTRVGDIHICELCKYKMKSVGRRKTGSTDAMLIAIRGGFGVKR